MTPETENLSDEDLFDNITDDIQDESHEVDAGADEQQVENEGEKAEAEVEAVADEEKSDDGDSNGQGRIPSFRLREERERAERAERELERLRSENQRLSQPQKQEQPKVDEEPEPDPLVDPKGYRDFIEKRIESRLLDERRNDSLAMARDANPEAFDEAYHAAGRAIASGDVGLKARMQASRNPGRTLMEWHKENKARAEIGNDIEAYKQRIREEALKDPEFQKRVAEVLNSSANRRSQENGGRPRIQLPPSLNGVSRSRAALSSQDSMSDDALFDAITS